MKDIFGKGIKEGQEVFYFKFLRGLKAEFAKVILVRSNSVRLRYHGGNEGGKRKGQESNIYNTTGKIYILEDHVVENTYLKEKIKRLEEELDQIHNRFDILDL